MISDTRTITYCRIALSKESLDTIHKPMPKSMHMLLSKSLLIFS